ncbi:hypothetical protein JCM8208_005485 [Rhodotorula glutinis]
MSSPPASSAAAVVEPDDPLFHQVKAVYSFFKDASGTGYRDDSTSEARYNAARALNAAAGRAPAIVARSWGNVSSAQHMRMLELLLEYYCESRVSPDLRPPPISFEQLRDHVGYSRSLKNRQAGVPASDLTAFKRPDKFLGVLVTLYNSPIDGREYQAFEAVRHDIGEARRQLTRARNANPRRVGHAQNIYDEAEEGFEDRLAEANAERVEHVQQVKAAFSLLHDNAALVPGFDDVAQHAAVEVYFSRLNPDQQAGVVARVRRFVFAACEERAVRGEALDPDEQLVDILGALHARDLGHALCAARLNSVVYFFESHSAPSPVVEHFQGVVDQFCGDVWAHRFPRLAPSQQLYAVGMVRALLGRIQSLTAREVADELAVILPMNASNPTSWKHPPQVDGPPVVLRSLAHHPSTLHAPFGVDATGSPPSSRFFPQARSARW